MTMPGEIKEPKFREDDRRATHLAATARIPHADASMTVLNLSPTGCKVRTTSTAACVGTTVLLSLSSKEEAAGEIVWRDGDECGVHFHRPISEKAMLKLTGWSF